ncbi:hypothetical protein Btru_005743 [Bulinus truncatus]|nr:hypothetical protein Btru_005743 [Bulinus truncatus]
MEVCRLRSITGSESNQKLQYRDGKEEFTLVINQVNIFVKKKLLDSVSDVTMTAMAEDVDDRFAGIDIDSLLNRAERRPFNYGRKKTLYEAPEFIQRLQGEETVMEGQSLCIDCKVAGFPVPTLRWFKDDEQIIDHPRIHVESDGTGGYSLIIACVNKGDEAAYRCRAENIEGASSSCFFLSVRAKPKSQKKKDSKSAPNRRTVSFPPMFATIVEKVEEEEKQGKELQHLPPSPMTEFYYALTLKSRQSWPTFVGDWAFTKRRTVDDDDHEDDVDELENVPPVANGDIDGRRDHKESQGRVAGDSGVTKKPPLGPKGKDDPSRKTFSKPEGKEEKEETQVKRRRRERDAANKEMTSHKQESDQAESSLRGKKTADPADKKADDRKGAGIGNQEKEDAKAVVKLPLPSALAELDQVDDSKSKYQKMKEELLKMEKDMERKLQAKMKRDEEEKKKLEEKRKQETLAKIEEQKARLREDEARRMELKKQLEEDKKKQEEEERKVAEALKKEQNNNKLKMVGTTGGKGEEAKQETVKRNGPAALAMFQNKLNKPDEQDKKSLKNEAQKTTNKPGDNTSQNQRQPYKSSAPLTPADAMRQREKEQIDNLKQREKQQIEDLRKREQKQLDELRAKRQKFEGKEDAAGNKGVNDVKKTVKAEEKVKTAQEKQKEVEKEKEERAKEKSQISALRGKELKQREELGAREAQQLQDLRMKDIRLREDMRQSHERSDAEEKQKEGEERRKAKEEEERRLDKKKELMRKEQLRRQYEEETRKRQVKAQENEMKQGGEPVIDEEKKVYKRDYSFQDLRKSLESQLGADVINEEEHKYWDDILEKHNYTIADRKKAFDPSLNAEQPPRIRSRRNSVEEADLLKLKRSGSITDLKETYTRSLGRPKKKPLPDDGEKRQKDEMFLKRAASISDLRQQFLEVAHKPPSGAKLLGVPGKQEAEITIRNRKNISDTIRPSEIRQRSKSPTPMPFMNTSASSPSLQQMPESKQLARKQTELMKLAGAVATKRATFLENSAPPTTQKRNFGRDAYGSREIPAYKRAAGWSDDIGNSPKVENANTENARTKQIEKPSDKSPVVSKTGPSPSPPGTIQKTLAPSSTDITARPFLYNSTRTTARSEYIILCNI